MERIKSIEQLRMQKELLQLQRMITELRMKKEMHVIRRRMGITNVLFPSMKELLKAGIKTRIGKQIVYSTAAAIGKKIFRKRSSVKRES